MKFTGTLITLLGATCVVALADIAPAMADEKPCCTNGREYYNATPSTCRKYGGRIIDQSYCRSNYYPGGGYYGDESYRGGDYYYGSRPRGGGVTFSITLGDVMFAYSDGYYDRYRRWHGWHNNNERDWYRRNHRESYFEMRRDHDNDRYRRDWRDGRRRDWHGG